MMLGNKQFDLDKNDNIIIGGVSYAGTSGLYHLIFRKIPHKESYTQDDLQTYKSILLSTNAHRRNRDPKLPILSNKGYKYKYVIAPITQVTALKKKVGSGNVPRAMTVTDDKIEYVHWDDPNELVDRLRLLEASRKAGNNAHDNEILSIVEELREAGVIIN